MLRIILCAALLAGAPAQESAQADAMKKLEFLVGEWDGQGEAPGIGKYTDEYVYEWTPNKTFIKSVYVMKVGEKPVWTDIGWLGWDPEKKKYYGFNFGMDGTIGWGNQQESEDKDILIIMEGQTSGPGQKEEFRAILRKIDADHLSASCEMKKDGKYVSVMGAQKYERRKAGKKEESKVPASPRFSEELKKLEFLVGSWQGKGEYAGRSAYEAEYIYEWILNKNFLKKTMVAKAFNQVAWSQTDLIGWDKDKGKIVVFSFGLDGTFGLGTAVSTEKETFVAEGTNIGPHPVKEWRTTHKKTGEGKFEANFERKQDGKYETYNKVSAELKK